jgi:hypothetical protein
MSKSKIFPIPSVGGPETILFGAQVHHPRTIMDQRLDFSRTPKTFDVIGEIPPNPLNPRLRAEALWRAGVFYCVEKVRFSPG